MSSKVLKIGPAFGPNKLKASGGLYTTRGIDAKITANIASGSGPVGFTPDPGITASGLFSDGQSVTVNKATGGLGIKPNGAKPLYYFPLETNLLPHPTLSRTQTAPTPDPTTTIQTSVKPSNAAGAASTVAADSNFSVPPPIIFQDPLIYTPTANGNMYCFMKRYYGHAWSWTGTPSINLKTMRGWEPFPGSLPDHASVFWASDTGVQDDRDSGGLVWFNFSSPPGTRPPATSNAWLTCEHFWTSGTVGNSDGIRNYAQDGLLCYPQSVTQQNWFSGHPGLRNEWFFDEYSSTGNLGFDYKHSLYFDDSFFRIMASNESTLSTSSAVREIQIPTSWSDTSVSFVIRKGSFVSLTGVYLWLYTGPYTAIRLGHFS